MPMPQKSKTFQTTPPHVGGRLFGIGEAKEGEAEEGEGTLLIAHGKARKKDSQKKEGGIDVFGPQ